MKIRTDFVTNSSSSSFIIQKEYLTEKQIEKIINHQHYGEKYNIPFAKTDNWNIDESETSICGSTFMDNFNMYDFFKKIKVDMTKVEWGN